MIRFRDLGVERGIYPASSSWYRVRAAAVNAGRDADRWSEWSLVERLEVPLTLAPPADAGRFPFVAVHVEVDRGGGWSRTVTAYAALASRRIVAVER